MPGLNILGTTVGKKVLLQLRRWQELARLRDVSRNTQSRSARMQTSPASPEYPPTAPAIVPFHGTVTVRFSDAIVASSERAKMLCKDGRDPVFYIPFEDIYFELFEKTNAISESALGTAASWRVHAAGASADNFMWAYETPETAALAVARHGAFDPHKACIDADPVEDKQHTPHLPE